MSVCAVRLLSNVHRAIEPHLFSVGSNAIGLVEPRKPASNEKTHSNTVNSSSIHYCTTVEVSASGTEKQDGDRAVSQSGAAS